MTQEYTTLRNNISMLGRFLGETINDAQGADILELIENIRKLSRNSRAGDDKARQELLDTLGSISNDNIIPVARAFSQFLNLTNIAEQYQTISREHSLAQSSSQSLSELFKRLKEQNASVEDVHKTVEKLLIELVLTAHPTETTRRSLIHKHIEINKCLSKLEHHDLTEKERNIIERLLLRLIAEAWHTNEIRTVRPTPFDEAKWGFAMLENSLWQAVPEFLRQLNETAREFLGYDLRVGLKPVLISSWMGGDRDGNPFVTAQITKKVLYFARWKAADLFLQDISKLADELSMVKCSDEFRAKYGEHLEPYRFVVKNLRNQLTATLAYFDDHLSDRTPRVSESEIILEDNQLWEPLYDCYQSLIQCGMRIIANGSLLNILHRISCFGVTLSQMDIRQESTRHTDAIAEITRYIGLGDYSQWTEDDKQAFLIRELSSRRPLIPQNWTPSPETKEILDTCKVIAQQKQGWYRGVINNRQMVMIGYSDSAKDAGMMAASWAQYRAQEALVNLTEKLGIELTLFHGRGGTIGRGGAPAHAALLSQPPRSLKNGLRVTEQGEMIRFKLGLPAVAVETFDLYASAILEANLLPPPEPKPEWRTIMDELSTISCDIYRGVVRGDKDFVPYFRSATPEQELSKLPLGSRPAKRNPNGGVESLRAIPWIFAWMQNRLMLPAWLGAGASIRQIIEQGKGDVIHEMCENWPFFSTRIGMLEMVFSKSDTWLSQQYDQRLVKKELWYLGENLRKQLEDDIQTVLSLSHQSELMSDLPWIADSIALRNIYTDPLNLLQVELLHRFRENPEQVNPDVEQALMITITGIAAGMRNTG